MSGYKNLTSLERSVLLTLILTVLAVSPYSVMDPMNLPKMTILGVMSFLTLGLMIRSARILVTKEFRIILGFAITLQVILICNLLLSGRNIAENLYGAYGRNTGVLTYIALIIIMVASSIVSEKKFVDALRVTLFGIGTILLIYGCLQFAGLEPFPYVNAYENNVFGTFGNPNFQSSFMGILGATAFVTTFDEKLRVSTRSLVGGIFIASILGIYSTNSWQGFFNLTAGAVVGLILLLFNWKRHKSAYGVLSISVCSGIIIAFGIFNKGPLANVIGKVSLEARRLYWESAVNIIGSNSVFGVGFDGFGDWFRRGRSEDAALNSGGLLSTSAHSVPLDIGVGGGMPALSIYLGLIALALWRIAQNVKSSNGVSVAYVSICAGWISYQAQTLISINQIGLGIIGWILLGVVIGYKTPSEVGVPQKRATKANQTNITFVSFIAPIIGLTIGLIVALPPYVSASKFFSSLKTSEIELVQSTALLAPQDSQRMLYAVQILENNNYNNEAITMVKEVNKSFPDSYEAWKFLSVLKNSTESDKQVAVKQMRRLDPNYID